MLRFLSFAGPFIATCAVSYSIFYSYIFKEPLIIYKLIFIFFGTIGSYLLVQLIPLRKITPNFSRQLWLKSHYKKLMSIVISSSIIVVISVFKLSLPEIIIYSHLFLIVIFYEKLILNKKELRKIPYLKPFIISYVWAMTCSGIQCLQNNSLILFIESFLYVLALTIPFDIRDEKYDHSQGLKTLIHLLGINTTKILCLLIFLVSQLILINELGFKIFNFFLLIVYSFLLSKAKNNQHDYFFLYGFDSLLILKLSLLL